MTGQPRTSDERTIQVVLIPSVIDPFVAWLASRGAQLTPIPTDGSDELPTYVISPVEWAEVERLAVGLHREEHADHLASTGCMSGHRLRARRLLGLL